MVPQLVGALYPMMADPEGRVARTYGVYNLLGDGRAAPSTFVIGGDGRVRWSYIGHHSHDRPTTKQILRQLT
jgi:alkyl hydroperoxide reductase subunit AhpC